MSDTDRDDYVRVSELTLEELNALHEHIDYSNYMGTVSEITKHPKAWREWGDE